MKFLIVIVAASMVAMTSAASTANLPSGASNIAEKLNCTIGVLEGDAGGLLTSDQKTQLEGIESDAQSLSPSSPTFEQDAKSLLQSLITFLQGVFSGLGGVGDKIKSDIQNTCNVSLPILNNNGQS